MIFFPHCKITFVILLGFFVCFINRKTFRKMSFNVFSYTVHTQLCSLATTIATPPLTLSICSVLYSATMPVLRPLWSLTVEPLLHIQRDRSVIAKYEDLSSLRNWYTITFPLTRKRHRCHWTRLWWLRTGPLLADPNPPAPLYCTVLASFGRLCFQLCWPSVRSF